ncbi:N-acetylmuramic acid 6-phosphate etherase [uncultured Cohaesibacter sp.]|uniref:N-acetylmuramic acid 6-phosphate etherase n=1 Tax=uncultured Cohaesibacter sp. TaxID=1002546 RepID=UPI00292ED383|nr:N-acetylmuramic acid 6-phosphate etherase [uncultured Cohaesibacter sp.]
MSNVTEKLHSKAKELDTRSPCDIASLIAQNQIAAAQVTAGAVSQICTGSELMANSIEQGGSLIYAAAGSSALMALADAMELGGSFGIGSEQIQLLMAGGIPRKAEMPGDTEDETGTLSADLAAIGAKDTLIAISASGRTPYTLEAANIARRAGAKVIAIANNDKTPLLEIADVAIHLPTEAEVIAGSTRMGAATAQKIALNMLSTVMAVHLGHVYDGMMVNLKADNAKLRHRARMMVRSITSVSEEAAEEALVLAEGNVKVASLIAAGTLSKDLAHELILEEKGLLRNALGRVKSSLNT